jgi:glycosyltransferase involved in cell wall biosynthesis
LLCLRNDREPPVGEELERRFAVAVEVARRDHSRRLHWRALRGIRSRAGLLLGRPMWTDDVGDARFRTALREFAERWRPDLVVIFYPIMGAYLHELTRFPVPRVLVEPDPASFAAAERAVWEPAWGRLVHALDGRVWRSFERRVLSGVSTVVVFTEQDERTLADAGRGTPVVTIPFGTEFVERPPSPPSDEPAILFVGSFLHAPNREAAVRLARDVFPRVRSRRGDARLFLVGHRPPPDVVRTEGVTVTGVVPDLAPFYARSALVVAPLRLGGGMRVKVVEALAAGKPVVASRLAVAGLAVEDGEHLLLAESDDEFVDRIEQLLGDPALRRRLGTAARAWAEANLGWNSIVERHERLYRELVDRAREAAEARETASS